MNIMQDRTTRRNTDIFFWQAMPSHHQYSTFLVLHDMTNGRITFVLEQKEDTFRKSQGWNSVDLTKLNVIFLPASKLWRDGAKLIKANPDAVHVFVAFRGTKQANDYFPLILYSLRRKVKLAVLNEPYAVSPIGYFRDEHFLFTHFKVWFRPILYRVMAFLINFASRSQKPCIFSLSLIAKEQFKTAGFLEETIFPWGWFVPRFNGDHQKEKTGQTGKNTLRIAYFGSLLKTKGIDILVKAVIFLRAQGYNISVDIYGSGNGRDYEYPKEEIIYKGLLSYESVQPAMRQYDVVALPSRHDGWGVVVNQALLQGVPFIASSRVGAKCLLEASGAGLVFESENVNDLADKIKTLIENPILLKELRANALKAGEEILPEKGAQYFLDVLSYYFYGVGVRPSALWSDKLPEKNTRNIDNALE
jgi:glycosyltransferase involved in cell wall biosynthesis